MSLNKNVSLYVSNVPLQESSHSTNNDPASFHGHGDPSREEQEEEKPDYPHRKLRRLGEDPSRSSIDTMATLTPSATTTADGGESGSSFAAAANTPVVVDECPSELKTLRYKIMLMNGNTPVEVPPPPAKNSYENLQLFLEKEKNHNNKENWNKLNRSVKNKKVSEFVQNYATANELTEEEHTRLLEMLKLNMGKGKLTKNKEVIYDKTKGVIKEMPCLVFNKVTRHFTIKNMDAAAKHSGTIKKPPVGKSGGGGGGGGGQYFL
jgi:hypothetical protein